MAADETPPTLTVLLPSPAAKTRCQYVELGRTGPARLRLDMPDGGKIAFQPGEQRGFRTALEDFRKKSPVFGQNLAGEVSGKLDQADDAQMIGLLMAGRIGRHIRQHDVGRSAEPILQNARRL